MQPDEGILTDNETLATVTPELNQAKKAKRVRFGSFGLQKKLNYFDENLSSAKQSKDSKVILWRDSDGYDHFVCISKCIISRLSECYTMFTNSEKTCSQALEQFLRQKYLSSEDANFGAVFPRSFFVLCRETLGVQFEFFSDAISQSNELHYYCSMDSNDRQFGSTGVWDELEEEIEGAAGFPAFDSTKLDSLMDRMNINMMKPRPYCRILAVPVYNGSRLQMALEDPLDNSDVLVRIPKDRFNVLKHRFDFFRYGLPGLDFFLEEEESEALENSNNSRLPSCICIALWINQHYKEKYLVPRDVAECFLAWAASAFGDANLVNRQVFTTLFPLALRSMKEKEELFNKG